MKRDFSGIDFADYKTFDWMAQPVDLQDPLGDYPTVGLRIKNAVENELEEKGFLKVDSSPDFYVVYHASVKQKLTRTYIDGWGYYYPRYRRNPPVRRPVYRRYPPAVWGSVYVDAYDEGTLVIDIVDAETNELAWRGAASGAVGDPARAVEKIDEAVRVILETFPPFMIEDEAGEAHLSAVER